MDSHVSHNGIARVIDEMTRLDQEIARLQQENRAQSEKTEGLRISLKELAPALANILAYQVVARAGGDAVQLKRYYTETRDLLPQSLENQESSWREDLEKAFDRAIDIQILHEPRMKDWRRLDVDVGPKPESEPEKKKTKILFLSVTPADLPRLGAGDELRSIKDALLKGPFRDRFEIEQETAVRRSDLQHLLMCHEPTIVHFSGHGSSTGEIILRDEEDVGRPVPQEALSRLFALLGSTVRCVVLNACYSQDQADAISQHIDVVVGTKGAIGDRDASCFAAAFYQALAFGKSLQEAFDLGRNAIRLEDLPDSDKPQLLCPRADPATMTFVT